MQDCWVHSRPASVAHAWVHLPTPSSRPPTGLLSPKCRWAHPCRAHDPLTPCRFRSCLGTPADPIHVTSHRTSAPKQGWAHHPLSRSSPLNITFATPPTPAFFRTSTPRTAERPTPWTGHHLHPLPHAAKCCLQRPHPHPRSGLLRQGVLGARPAEQIITLNIASAPPPPPPLFRASTPRSAGRTTH